MFFSKNIGMLLASAAFSDAAPYYNWKQVGVPVLGNAPYPNTTIAGLTVIDTPIVRAAREFTRAHADDATYKHQVRSWLFGSQIIANNETLKNTIDIEVQAVAAILHDLGWDQTPGSDVITPDHRFEVDGAIASRKFIEDFGDDNWDPRRTQLVFDAIALHTTRTIGYYKEPEVRMTSLGISVDYDGPKEGVTPEVYAAILAEFPNDDLVKATNETFTWVCATKPDITYGKTCTPTLHYLLPTY